MNPSKGKTIDPPHKQITNIKVRYTLLEQKYKAEVEKNHALQNTIAKLKADKNAKINGGLETHSFKMTDLESKIAIHGELIQTNANLVESKVLAIQNLNAIIKAQEAEIERLTQYKKDYFSLKQKELEQERSLATREINEDIKKHLNSSYSEQQWLQELKEAKNKAKLIKRKMVKNFTENEKKIEKINEKIYELEKRIKNLTLKLEKTVKIVQDFDRIKSKFKKVIKFCFIRFHNINEKINNGIRKAIAKINNNSTNNDKSLKELSSEFDFYGQKLREYHEIINEIGESINFDFNKDALEQIYSHLKLRTSITIGLKKNFQAIIKPDISESEIENLVCRMTEMRIHDGDIKNECVILIKINGN